MSWVVDSPELVAVHLLSFICHPWCSSCSMNNNNNQSPGLQLLIITVHSSKNLIIPHYNGTVRLLIRHIWQNFFLVKNLLEWFLSLFISISWCPTTHLARGSPNVKKNTHPVFQHISHLWYMLMMTHCVGTSNSGGILIFSLSFSKYC